VTFGAPTRSNAVAICASGLLPVNIWNRRRPDGAGRRRRESPARYMLTKIQALVGRSVPCCKRSIGRSGRFASRTCSWIQSAIEIGDNARHATTALQAERTHCYHRTAERSSRKTSTARELKFPRACEFDRPARQRGASLRRRVVLSRLSDGCCQRAAVFETKRCMTADDRCEACVGIRAPE
jgi:hypothetical protein